MLEFIFVAPILLILIAFVVDLGMALYTKNALANATQASVRAASQRGGTVIDGRQVARDHFYAVVDDTPGLNRDQVVSYQAGPNLCTNASSTVTARSTYQYRFITPGLNTIFGMIGASPVGSGLILEGASALRCEIAWQ